MKTVKKKLSYKYLKFSVVRRRQQQTTSPVLYNMYAIRGLCYYGMTHYKDIHNGMGDIPQGKLIV